MKKRSGLGRAVPSVAKNGLEAMNTKALLARLDRLRFCEDNAQSSDLLPHEVSACDGILFKDSQAWQQAYRDVKSVLADREHIPRQQSRKQ